MNVVDPKVNEPCALQKIVALQILSNKESRYSACKTDPFFEKVLGNIWFQLKWDMPEGSLHLRSLMEQIEHLKNSNSKCFEKLAEVFSSRFEQAQIELKEKIPLSCEKYIQLQKVEQEREDESLSIICSNMLGFPEMQADELRGHLLGIVDHLSALQSLPIQYSGIQAIPAEIGLFINLTNLSFSSCSLKTIPEFLCKLPKLKELSLRDNKIEQLPLSFGRYPCLNFLDLGTNRIKKIDKGAFSSCLALGRVWLDNNEITDIHPKSFILCPNLKDVLLGENRIEGFIPGTFKSFPLFWEPALQGNPISSFSYFIEQWEYAAVYGFESVGRQERVKQAFEKLSIEDQNSFLELYFQVPGIAYDIFMCEIFDLTDESFSRFSSAVQQWISIKFDRLTQEKKDLVNGYVEKMRNTPNRFGQMNNALSLQQVKDRGYQYGHIFARGMVYLNVICADGVHST